MKIGDRVKCLKPDAHWLRKGKTYTIHDVITNYFDGRIDVMIELTKPRSILWSSRRFEKVQPID